MRSAARGLQRVRHASAPCCPPTLSRALQRWEQSSSSKPGVQFVTMWPLLSRMKPVPLPSGASTTAAWRALHTDRPCANASCVESVAEHSWIVPHPPTRVTSNMLTTLYVFLSKRLTTACSLCTPQPLVSV